MIPVLVMACAAQTPWGRIDPPPGLECVSKGSDALVLQPEEFLDAPHVRRIDLSSNGAHALIYATARADEALWENQTELKVLDTKARALRNIKLFPAGNAETVQIEWALPGKAYALVSRRDQTHEFALVDAVRGTWTILGRDTFEDLGPFPRLFVSPKGQTVVLGQKVEFGSGGSIDAEQFVFRSLDEKGLGQAASFTRETSGPMGADWSPDGRFLKLRVQRGTRAEYATFDTTLASLAYEQRGPDAELEAPDFSLVRRRLMVEANRWNHQVDTLWFEASLPSDEPSAFVCAEPEAWALSPNLDFILYSSKGALWMKGLKRMRISDVRELQIKAIQDRATAQAQRMGRAVVLFWRDNGHLFPARDQFHQAIRAYNEDDEAIERFVATFQGGAATLGTDTETTPVGYIDAKIGRAYVMLDGTVRWEFNPKSN